MLATDFDHGRACDNCGALDLDRRLRQAGVTPREAEVLELLASRLTNAEIADALAQARGLKVDRKRIRLEDPIREVGTYMVEVEIGGGVTAKVKTIVAEAK